jgi:hypothetical protein
MAWVITMYMNAAWVAFARQKPPVSRHRSPPRATTIVKKIHHVRLAVRATYLSLVTRVAVDTAWIRAITMGTTAHTNRGATSSSVWRASMGINGSYLGLAAHAAKYSRGMTRRNCR